MAFVNTYQVPPAGRVRRLVSTGGDGLLAVGGAGDPGLAVYIDLSGAARWARSYAPAGAAVEIIDGVPIRPGGFLLLAAAQPTRTGPPSTFLLRVDASGGVLWGRRLDVDWVPTRVLRRFEGQDEFVVLGTWTGRDPRTAQAIAMLRVDGGGSVLGGVELSTPRGMLLLDADATPDGYVLLAAVEQGGRGRSQRRLSRVTTPLAIAVTRDLTAALATFIRAADGTLTLHALRAGRAGVAVAGALAVKDGPRRAVLMSLRGTVKAGLAPGPAFAYRLSTGPAWPIRLDVLGSDFVALDRGEPNGAHATVWRASAVLDPVAHYDVLLPTGTESVDLRAASGDSVMVAGTDTVQTSPDPIALGVGLAFDCCKTAPLATPTGDRLTLEREPVRVTMSRLAAATTRVDVPLATLPVEVASLCGVSVDWLGERMVQSPHLNLQASGSDGSAASRGVLLRWMLAGALADHLPKGSLASSTQGFNRPNDVVTVYRAAWPDTVATRRLSFAVDRPIHVDEVGRTVYFETLTGATPDLYAVRFLDTAGYDVARLAVDPATDAPGFVAAYGARPMEVELRTGLALACDITFHVDAGGSLEVETCSVADGRLSGNRYVSARRILAAADGPVTRLLAENLRSVRVRGTSARLEEIAFVCYDDVLALVNAQRGWTALGAFGLTTDQATALQRLEEPGRFAVHGVWRKYNDGAFVNVGNYKARWADPAVGLQQAVATYAQLSDADPTATTDVAGADPDDGVIRLSYLDLLQVAALDYHVARMLGLGFVDATAGSLTPSIHLATYITTADLLDGGGARPVQHMYMSLPTTLADARLPLVPDLDPIEYGLSVPTSAGVPYQLTDADGYTPDGTTRFICLYPACPPLYEDDQSFFAAPDLFDLSESALPVLYGVEYRAQSEPHWRKPEIAHHPTLVDTASPAIAEVLSTPFPAEAHVQPFIHREMEAGVHEYAAYSVSLFSLASPVGSPRLTDHTVFRRRNTLLPPSDLQVQLIQRESPLLLTTNSEQNMLAAIEGAGGDPTLVRVCFNYGFTQDAAYEFADTVEILHRGQPPRSVVGGIAAVTVASDPALLEIETQSYSYASGEVADPVLPATLKPNFVGGVLVTGTSRLVVEDVRWSTSPGPNPVFVVRKPTTSGVIHNAGANVVVTQDATDPIHPGDLVMAIENMAAADSWGAGNPLASTVAIGDAGWPAPRVEAFTRADGSAVTRLVRGAWGTAEIQAHETEPPGYYRINFHTFVLGPHSQSTDADPVTWWKGVVRVPVDPASGRDPEDRRSLTVLQVATADDGSLMLIARDDTGDPDVVDVGPARLVNYHPGYRVYAHADASAGFDWAALAPAAGEGSRTTLLGLRSSDSSTFDAANQPYHSAVGSPQLMVAREIIEPGRPKRPHGLKYAGPPDAEGKSCYTVTVDFVAKPFAVVVSRADASSILEALYDPPTLVKVREIVFPLGGDPHVADRFYDLFAFIEDQRDVLDPFANSDGAPVALPPPDLPPLGVGAAPFDVVDKATMHAAVLGAFVPLSEQPLVYDLIRTDPDYLPTNRRQTFRDANGDLLRPGDPGFDLAPMAKRSTDDHSLQFTDFTLDGSMNPNTVYFYSAREIGNAMQLGDASEIFGPVKLVNLAPPPPPTVRKMSVAPLDEAAGANPEVRFTVLAPPPIDPIARVRLYRTGDPADALSLRTMPVVKDIDLATLTPDADGTLTVADDFSADALVPYGDPLFYKLAWVREVAYEDASQTMRLADVVSEPTRTFLANVVDVVNPQPPVPTITERSNPAGTDKLVRISWVPTVHNGTYHVSRLDASGNWAGLGVVNTNASPAVLDLPNALPVADEDGEPIYYRFRVDVVGPSGLVNLVEAPVTVRLDEL